MLALDLVIILFSYAVIGEPLRVLIRRYSHIFEDLDLLQIFTLDVFLGGFLLYVLASAPLGLFNLQVLTILLTVFSIFTVANLVQLVARKKLSDLATGFNSSMLVHLTSATCVLLVFALLLWIELAPMDTVILGSIDDASLHSMFVQLVLDNRMIPSIAAPFSSEGIIFPQGHTIFFAYPSVLLGWVSAKAVLYVTPLFMALSTFGAYFMGRKLSNRASFGAILAFITGFVATHPRYLTWGGNGFIIAFPLFMISLGILFCKTRVGEWKKTDLIVGGLLLGFLAAVYLPAFLVLVPLFFCDAFLQFARGHIGLKNAIHYSLLLSCSVLVIFPNIFRFLSFSVLPGRNIGLPADVKLDYTTMPSPSPTWALETIANQSFPFNVVVPSMIVFGTLALIIDHRVNKQQKMTMIALGTFLIPTALLLSASKFFQIREFTGVCTCVLALVSFNLPIAFFVYYVLSFFTSSYSFNGTSVRRLKTQKIFGLGALLFILLSPFVFYSVLNDKTLLAGGYGNYAVTTQDDYDLMLWMKYNLNQNSRILVARYDSGNFIPSVSNLPVVYPYTASQLSASYLTVIGNLHFGKLTALEYDFMKQHDVTHIFIGSKAAFWWTGDHRWYPKFFLDNPNFELVKNVGEAYLFRVLYRNPNVIFRDEFNHSSFNSSRWSIYVPQQFSNSGTGSISEELLEENEMTCFKISTQKSENASLFWYSIVKDVYLGDYPNVTKDIMISFYIKTASVFGSDDALDIIVSSGDWQQQVYFSASKRITVEEGNTVPIAFDGFCEFNLTNIWVSIYGNLPPNAPHLQIAIHDTDCFENIVYVGNVSITMNEGWR